MQKNLDYVGLKAALSRLRGTILKTNSETANRQIGDIFGLIGDGQIVREGIGKIEHIDITCLEWIYDPAISLGMLTYNREYFRLRGDLDRRFYELAREYTSMQNCWMINLIFCKKRCIEFA